jgi:hypothetical protein
VRRSPSPDRIQWAVQVIAPTPQINGPGYDGQYLAAVRTGHRGPRDGGAHGEERGGSTLQCHYSPKVVRPERSLACSNSVISCLVSEHPVPNCGSRNGGNAPNGAGAAVARAQKRPPRGRPLRSGTCPRQEDAGRPTSESEEEETISGIKWFVVGVWKKPLARRTAGRKQKTPASVNLEVVGYRRRHQLLVFSSGSPNEPLHYQIE